MTTDRSSDGERDQTARQLVLQGRALRQLARAIVRSAADADDVVQDAVVAAWQQRAARGPGYLVRTVRHLALRKLRERRRRQRRHDQLAMPVSTPATDELLIEIEAHQRVVEHLQALGEPYRRALVLRFWHGLPPRAIARQLGVPVATVKSHLQRALAELRARLDRGRGGRDAWMAALLPIAWPQVAAGSAGGAAVGAAGGGGVGATWVLGVLLMQGKLLSIACATFVVLGLGSWWLLAGEPPPEVEAAAADAGAIVAASGAPAESGASLVAATTSGSTPRTEPGVVRSDARNEPTCEVVGRIVGPGGVPVANSRIRLESAANDGAIVTGEVAPDGWFRVGVPVNAPLLAHGWAVAVAAGWAATAVEFDPDRKREAATGRLDLGIFELERGVAVTGRIVEADGAPLRNPALLVLVKPERDYRFDTPNARLLGRVEAGGVFRLPERVPANPAALWHLVAVASSGLGWIDLGFAAGQEQLDPVELRLLRGGGLAVHVVGQDHAPIAGAMVLASPRMAPFLDACAGARSQPECSALLWRQTDERGWARFDGLPTRQETTSLLGLEPGWWLRKSWWVTARRSADSCASVEVDVAVEGGGEVELRLSGPTRQVSCSGVVRASGGALLAGVVVTHGSSSVTTDAHGRFEMLSWPWRADHAIVMVEGVEVPRTSVQIPVPAERDHFEQDLVVELRSPVTGIVVDDAGQPVAGVQLDIGRPGGLHYPGRVTGEDGAFAFPDALPSHTELYIVPPQPFTAWQLVRPHALQQRTGERIVLERRHEPLVALTLRIADGESGAPLSPREVEVERRIAGDRDPREWHLEPTLAFGSASLPGIRAGRYRASVRTVDGRSAVHEFEVTADAAAHAETIVLWHTVSLRCTLDLGALAADARRRLHGKEVLLALEGEGQQSYAVDERGERLPLTPNCGMFQIGSCDTVQLAGVTANTPVRLHLCGDDLCGETFCTLRPGEATAVTVRAMPFGDVALAGALLAHRGHGVAEERNGANWRQVCSFRCGADVAAPRWHTATGEHTFRVRLWPDDGGDPIERELRVRVEVGATTTVTLD